MNKQPLTTPTAKRKNKKPNHNLQVGKWGEELAAEFLVGKGYEILAKNVHTPYGELDVICLKDGMVNFVEVKTRTNTDLGYPEAGLTKVKIRHLVQASEEYLLNHPELPGEWSVDLIAILGRPGSDHPNIEHFENVANG